MRFVIAVAIICVFLLITVLLYGLLKYIYLRIGDFFKDRFDFDSQKINGVEYKKTWAGVLPVWINKRPFWIYYSSKNGRMSPGEMTFALLKE